VSDRDCSRYQWCRARIAVILRLLWGCVRDRALDRIGIHLDAAIGDKAHEAIPMLEAVADRGGNDRFSGHACELPFKPDFQSIHERLALRLARGEAFSGAAAADPLLDCIERSNARERFLRDRRRTIGPNSADGNGQAGRRDGRGGDLLFSTIGCGGGT
jgi:hypothetical protein